MSQSVPVYVVTVRFDVDKEHLAEFQAAVLRQAARSLELEEECRVFDVCQSEQDPTRIFLYEMYDDQAAFQRHLASEHFRAFDQQVRDWVTDKRVDCWIRK